jgi:hypothetical protein
MKNKAASIVIALALAAGISTAAAQTLVWSDTEFIVSPIPTGWDATGWPGYLQSVNGQLVVTLSPLIPAPTNNISATHVPGLHTLPSFGALPDNQTLELRAELVSANQNDAFANIALNWAAPALGSGYMFSKDEDELNLVKFYNQGTSLAYFFYTNQPVKNQNVTLVLALTREDSNVKINMRVLDRDNANAVLFDHTVTDTPQADEVLPNRSGRGFICMPDPPGNPWPLLGSPGLAQLCVTWGNPQQAPNPRAQVVFDNLELWQYQTPQLGIQNAVVLSWPVTATQFVLESAPGVQGPWEVVSAPWSRTNATQIEVSVPAPDSMRLFRLKFAP